MAKAKTTTVPTLADVLARKRPRVIRVPVAVLPEAVEPLLEARNRATAAAKVLEARQAALEAVDATEEPERAERGAVALEAARQLDAEARKALAALRRKYPDAVVMFTFTAVSPSDYQALVNACQPSPAERKAAEREGRRLPFSEVTFPPAIVAACLTDPAGDAETVAAIWDDPAWCTAEVNALVDAALLVNTATDSLPVDLSGPEPLRLP